MKAKNGNRNKIYLPSLQQGKGKEKHDFFKKYDTTILIVEKKC